jgi:ferritin-like metal-binding protein YciE
VNKSLTITEQREVTFYNDQLIAVRTTDGHIYVSVRHLCEALGLDRRGQVRRIQRQEILAEAYQMGSIESEGGAQEAGLLRVDLLPLWLTGISIKSVKPELQERLKRYQREAAKVLWDAFQEGRLTNQTNFEELLKADSPAAQAYKMLQAMIQIAQQQLILEARMESHSSRMDDHEKRLESIETTLGDPGRFITAEQAMQISQAVKAIAMEIQKRTRKNEYGAVYGQMYREFGITGYKQLPAEKFDAAIKWLTDWYRRTTGATGDDLPF